MKGYLLKEQNIIIGEETFIESNSSENDFSVMFEDDAETGYFYAAERNTGDMPLRILDMLHIYDVESIAAAERTAKLAIVWSTDWKRCALVLNSYCHALIDFEGHGAYNRNEFPPPNGIWTNGDRKLSDALVSKFFS